MVRIRAGALFVGLLLAPQVTVAQVFERVVRVGGDDGPQEYVFGGVADIAFGPDSSLYVLDMMNGEVRVFGLDGRFRRKFGRKGKGPGEFELGSKLTVTHTEVWVVDKMLRRLVRFSHNGEHLETSNTPGAALGVDEVIPLRFGYWLGARTAMSSEPWHALVESSAARVERDGPSARRATFYLAGVFKQDASKLDTLLEYDHGRVLFVVLGRAMGVLRVGWEPNGGWATSGDSLVVLVDGARARVQVLSVSQDGLRHVKSGKVTVTPRRLSRKDWQEAEAATRDQTELPPRIYLVGPEQAPLLGRPLMANGNTVWIRRLTGELPSAEGRSTRYLLVPLDGRSQTHVELPDGFWLTEVKGDLLLGVRRTPLGSAVVEVLRQKPAA